MKVYVLYDATAKEYVKAGRRLTYGTVGQIKCAITNMAHAYRWGDSGPIKKGRKYEIHEFAFDKVTETIEFKNDKK